jgi:hypothetical protein
MVPITGDRGFESRFLQRRARCEPDFQKIPSFALLTCIGWVSNCILLSGSSEVRGYWGGGSAQHWRPAVAGLGDRACCRRTSRPSPDSRSRRCLQMDASKTNALACRLARYLGRNLCRQFEANGKVHRRYGHRCDGRAVGVAPSASAPERHGNEIASRFRGYPAARVSSSRSK